MSDSQEKKALSPAGTHRADSLELARQLLNEDFIKKNIYLHIIKLSPSFLPYQMPTWLPGHFHCRAEPGAGGTGWHSTWCSRLLAGPSAAFLWKPGLSVIHPPPASVTAGSLGGLQTTASAVAPSRTHWNTQAPNTVTRPCVKPRAHFSRAQLYPDTWKGRRQAAHIHDVILWSQQQIPSSLWELAPSIKIFQS